MRLAGDEKNPKLVAYPVDGNDGAIVDLGELAFQRRRLDLDDIGPGMGNLDADGDIRSDAHIAIFDRLTIAAYRHSGSRWPLALILDPKSDALTLTDDAETWSSREHDVTIALVLVARNQ